MTATGKKLAVPLALLKEARAWLLASAAERRHAKGGPLHLWRLKREFQIRFLKQAGLQPEHWLLDIGCGTLRGGVPIIEYLNEGHYSGIESRAGVLAEAGKEVQEAGLQARKPVLILSEDLSLLHIPTRFDFIWSFSVLLHMTDEILDGCFGFVSRHLKPSGSFYANVGIGQRRDARLTWQGFPVVWRTTGFYQRAGTRHGLSMADIGTLASLGHVSGLPAIDQQRMLRFYRTQDHV